MALIFKNYQPQHNKDEAWKRMKCHGLNDSEKNMNLANNKGRASLKNWPKIHVVNNKKR